MMTTVITGGGKIPSYIPECPSDLATLRDVHKEKRPQGARPPGVKKAKIKDEKNFKKQISKIEKMSKKQITKKFQPDT